MNNDISIILRTRDRYIMLSRALNDIICQTYKNWVIILVNDGGDLNKINKIIEQKKEKIKGRIKIVNIKENKGLNVAINVGARNVKTDFVVVHDDDDTWKETFLEESISALNKYNCMGIVCHTNKVYEDVKNNTIKIKRTKSFNQHLQGVIPINEMLQYNQFPPISFLYRTCVYEEIGYYDESLLVLEDWEFYIRFILKFDIYVLEKTLANYHIRINKYSKVFGNTITTNKKEHIKYANIIKNRMIREYIKDNAKEGLFVGIYSGQEYNSVKLFIKKVLKL